MTGAEFLIYMQRRLAENGLEAEDERAIELLDYATEGRDAIILALAEAAPVVVKSLVTLAVDVDNDRRYRLPYDTRDPYRVLCLRDAGSGRELSPSSQLDEDGGEYAWRTIRQVQLARGVELCGALEGEFVLHPGPITPESAEDAIGIPTTCHRAAAKLGVVLALTADEASDATNAVGLFQREIDALEKVYGEYDANGGLALRHALLKSIGAAYGDTLS